MKIKNGDQIGPYTIRKTLSESGGMSQVFLANDTERPLYTAAIKVQLAHDDNRATFQDLLRQEADILRHLRHPGIVRIYPLRMDSRVAYVARAYNHPNQPWYYAMEHIQRGNSLDHYRKEIKDYPVIWIVELFYQLLTVVQYIHKNGYAHGDLKPQNIMLRHKPATNEVPMPVLIDFGSATNVKEGIKQLSASIRYSAPEIVRALDRRDMPPHEIVRYPRKADIWALGAIFFEMLTGRPLIDQKRPREITTTILQGELDTIRSLNEDVHQSLDTLLSKMLCRKPEDRPTIKVLIQAIEERIFSVRPPRIG